MVMQLDEFISLYATALFPDLHTNNLEEHLHFNKK